MKNECDSPKRKLPSPLFSKTAREWILSSALYDGIEDEDIRQIETLLTERGANPNVLLPEYGIAPFHMVVANESTKFAVQATDICLQHGADPNVRSEDGLTPVHLAAMWGCREVLQVLLASGGDPWLVDCFNKNAFDYAEEEKQSECHHILNSYCNSQPKPSGHAQSPYKLNLKRVVLYRNDLQIVYEASPSKSQKCAATQTSPSSVNPLPKKEKHKINNEEQHHIETQNVNEEDARSKNKFDSNFKSVKDQVKVFETPNRNKQVNERNGDRISSKLRDVILTHRRNSTVFEYSPERTRTSCSSGIVSWKDVQTSPEMFSSYASELMESLEIANKARKSIKTNPEEPGWLKNITERKKCPTDVTVEKFNFTNGNATADNLPREKCSPPNIGFILDNSLANSTILSRRRTASEVVLESPPSIGFVLDNLDETNPCTRGSSLFSDIESDLETSNTNSPLENVKTGDENLITEDESLSSQKTSPLQERQIPQRSSSDSLSPYVSCVEGNTRGVESSECFESCLEKNSTIDESRCGGNSSKQSISSKVASTDLDDILTNIRKNEKTPLNTNVVTSTPEIKSKNSAEFTFQTAGEPDIAQKPRWVEAQILSSSDEEPYMSISEEYQYTDMDEGVVLIEKRYLLDDISVPEKKLSSKRHVRSSTSGTEESEVSTISGSEAAYDTDELRRELQSHGFEAGPINGNTKRVYLRKLKRCRLKPEPPPRAGQPAYSPELLRTLEASCEHLLFEWAHLEDSMSASFTVGRRQWREGQSKTSFTYLLLDPRLAHNLPGRARTEEHSQLWSDFLQSVFYVGKGKRSRPYAHLYKAVELWQSHRSNNSKKIQRILDIWTSGQGVICLHVFLNIIPVEAFTREAAMISALTLAQLTNEKAGEFYGSAACWSTRLKRRLGCVLLHRAYKVFLAEGERQLRPADID